MSTSLNNQTIRFFVDDLDTEDNGWYDLKEVTEREFLEAKGVISYELHTVFDNGVNQICLTKSEF